MHKIAILAVGFALANCHHNAHRDAVDHKSTDNGSAQHHNVPDNGNTLTLAAIALGGIGITGFALRRRLAR